MPASAAASMWRLELLTCGDNMRPERSFVTLSFDGTWPQPESHAIWDHFLVLGPFAVTPHSPEGASPQ